MRDGDWDEVFDTSQENVATEQTQSVAKKRKIESTFSEGTADIPESLDLTDRQRVFVQE